MLVSTGGLADNKCVSFGINLFDQLASDCGHGVGHGARDLGMGVVNINFVSSDINSNHASVSSFHCWVPS